MKFYGDRLSNLILFGSQARHESTADSDIDILLILKGEISPGDETPSECVKNRFKSKIQ